MHKVYKRSLELNEKGQCPACKVKPITYKRDNMYFCCRCNRAFNMETGVQINNWAWKKT